MHSREECFAREIADLSEDDLDLLIAVCRRLSRSRAEADAPTLELDPDHRRRAPESPD